MTQAQFARALASPRMAWPEGLRSWNGSSAPERFKVYRNNVAHSLRVALAEGFPVVAQLVGDDFFAALARAFVRAHPPRSPVLVAWGDEFPSFIDGFMQGLAPDARLPYLADVARLERARVRAFHAADATVLAPAELAAHLARPEQLPRLRLQLQPGLTVLRSPYPVVSLWQAHQVDGDVQLPDWQNLPGEAALVLRQGQGLAGDVVVVPLPDEAASFVHALQGGAPLADASASAGPSLDLGAALALLIEHQALTGCSP